MYQESTKGWITRESATKVDLETKTVMIEEEKDYDKAVEILDDLGFTAVEQQ